MQKLSRRNFLRQAGAGTLALGGGMTNFLTTTAAHAANTSGYKALVCVYFGGGMDNYDTIIPFDQPSYDRYTNNRSSILAQYERLNGGSTRRRERLLEITPRNAADFGSRAFALPEELAPLHQLFQDGKASIIGNVGPLIEPMNRRQFQEGSRRRPARLFSHNDQQSAWLTLGPEGTRQGWGGRFADAALLARANSQPQFTAVSITGNEVFLNGDQTQQYTITPGIAETVRELNYDSVFFTGNASNNSLVHQLIDEHFRNAGAQRSNLFERDLAALRSNGIAANEIYRNAQLSAPALSVDFGTSTFARQMEAVAQMISIRQTLGAQRQVFMVTLGGFDSHGSQASSLPNLQRTAATSIAAFYQAMQQLGLENDVTLFTASDFGRTLSPNGDGTDHGWGSHQFVVGGGVNGGQIFGDIPEADFDHALDSGRGRLIPSMSVEQMAYPLGRWFGLNDAEVTRALPTFSTFGSAPAFI